MIEEFLISLGFEKTEWKKYTNRGGYEVSLEDGLKVTNPELSGVHEDPKIELYINHIPEKEVIKDLFEASGFLF